DGEYLVATGQRPQRRLPRGLAEEVGHDDGKAAAAGRTAQLLDRRGEIAAGALRGARHLRDLADQPAGVGKSAPGGEARHLLAGGDERADAVAAAAGEVRDRGER